MLPTALDHIGRAGFTARQSRVGCTPIVQPAQSGTASPQDRVTREANQEPPGLPLTVNHVAPRPRPSLSCFAAPLPCRSPPTIMRTSVSRPQSVLSRDDEPAHEGTDKEARTRKQGHRNGQESKDIATDKKARTRIAIPVTPTSSGITNPDPDTASSNRPIPTAARCRIAVYVLSASQPMTRRLRQRLRSWGSTSGGVPPKVVSRRASSSCGCWAPTGAGLPRGRRRCF